MYPSLFHIGQFPIATFGLMVGLGFLAAIAYSRYSVKKIPIDGERVYDLALVMMIAGLVGGRLGYILVEWEWFLDDPRSLIFSREGYVFYSGFLVAAAAVVFFARRWELPLWPLADAHAGAIALGHAFGRVGCYLNGCCYGNRCSLESPLTLFPKIVDAGGRLIGSPAYVEQLRQGLISEQHSHALAVHPTQLYEAGALLLLFGIIHGLSQRVRWVPGMLFLFYVVSYAIIRFVIEIFRGDQRGWIIQDWVSTSQGVALALLLVSPFFYFWLKKGREVR